MRYRVLKEILTPLHRYTEGAEFDASDADPALDIEHLLEHGRLALVLLAAPAEADDDPE